MRDGLCACGCGKTTTVPQRNSKRDGWVKGVPNKYVSGHNPIPTRRKTLLQHKCACGSDIWGRTRCKKFCDECMLERRKEKDKHSTRAFRQTPEYKEQYKTYILASKYGLTLEQYNLMLLSQNKRCAICGTREPCGKGWHVDHCHKTGLVRGILCTKCNCLLGMSGDSIDTLLSAIRYLSKATDGKYASIKELVN